MSINVGSLHQVSSFLEVIDEDDEEIPASLCVNIKCYIVTQCYSLIIFQLNDS